MCVLDALFLRSLLPLFHNAKEKENLSDKESGESFLSHLSPTETQGIGVWGLFPLLKMQESLSASSRSGSHNLQRTPQTVSYMLSEL